MANIANAINEHLFSTISSSIDFTTTANTTVYTTFPNTKFLIYSVAVLLDSVTGYVSDGAFNLGTNSTAFDNIINSSGFNVSTANSYIVTFQNSGFSTPSLLVSGGTPIIINIVTGITATTAIGRIILVGQYI